MHGLIGGPLGRLMQFCGGCWSRAGVRRDATNHGLVGTSTAGGIAEPAAYLTQTCRIAPGHCRTSGPLERTLGQFKA